MKLIIFGSTGCTGRQVVTQALEQGHDVTGFARSPEKLDQKHERLQVIKGNVLDLLRRPGLLIKQFVQLSARQLRQLDT